jgi:Ca2+-binding RTX toxin-like protein
MSLGLLPTPTVQITKAAIAVFGVAPGNFYLTQYLEYDKANGTAKTIDAIANLAGGTDAAFNVTFLTNLGLQDNAVAKAFMESSVAANGRGVAITTAFDALSKYAGTDTELTTAATSFSSKVVTGVSYSTNVANNSTDATQLAAAINSDAVAGSTSLSLTLTTGADNLTGGAGNDQFRAPNAGATAANQTLTTGDVMDGGAGTDTLSADVGSTGTYILNNTKNIETVSGTFTAAGTLSLSGSAGITTLVSNGSTAAAAFSNIADLATALKIENSALGATFGYTATAIAGTADTATLTLSNQTAGTNVIAGIETLTINSAGSANVIGTLTAAAATTLTITGDQSLNLGSSNTVATTIDASANTGGLTAISNHGSIAATITGGAGNDSITLTEGAAANNKVDLGAGKDTVIFTANLANTDTVTGGEGTDTLTAITADLTGYTKVATRTVTGIEKLDVSNKLAGDLTASNIGDGIAEVELSVGSDNTQRTITFETGSDGKIELKGTTVVGTSGLKAAVAGTGILDAVTINTNSTTPLFKGAGAGEPMAVDGAETITISTPKVAEIVAGITLTNSMGAAQTVNFTGAFGNTVGTITASSGSIAAIDASAMTVGASASGLSVTAGSKTVLTGSGGKDALTGSTGIDTIDGGAGIDTIVGGGGNDIISGGAGNDLITTGTGTAVSVNAGDGADTITVGANLKKSQTIDGGEGADILSMDNSSVTTFNALTVAEKAALKANISNVETLTFSANTGATIDIDKLVDVASAAKYSFGGAQTNTINGLPNAATLEYTTATSTGTVALKSATGTADSLAFEYKNSTTTNFGTQTFTGVETVSVKNADNDPADARETHTATLAGDASLKTLTVTGNNNAILTVTGGTKLATIDTSAATGTVNLVAAGGTVAKTITLGSGNSTVAGGSGADSITGGVGNDTLNGSSGADTIVGGAGNDIINGDQGSDSIVGGVGNDTISTSAGTDTIDGGEGTDTLKIANSVYGDISTLVTSSVETIDMNNVASTMTVAQFAGFTTFSNTAAVTFSDAGVIAGRSAAPLTLVLANGTNTFTASSTAADNVVTGGTGADTFNITSATFTNADVIKGGTGTDTINVTGNTANTITLPATVTGIEVINFANTSTAVSVTVNDAGVAAGLVQTIDASGLVSAALTIVGGAEADGSLKIVGGDGADNIATGDIADTIVSGGGADTIAGGSGIDVIDLTESVAAIDIVSIAAVATGNRDIISGFTAGATNGDKIKTETATDPIHTPNVASAILIQASAGNVDFSTGPGSAGADRDSIAAINSAVGLIIVTHADIVDLTSANSLTGANLLDAMIATGSAIVTTDANGEKLLFAIDDGTDTGIYFGNPGGSDAIVAASEISLIGVIKGVTADLLFEDNFTT